jgi:hypothetical protein
VQWIPVTGVVNFRGTPTGVLGSVCTLSIRVMVGAGVMWLVHLLAGQTLSILSGASVPHPQISSAALRFVFVAWIRIWCSGGCLCVLQVCHRDSTMVVNVKSTGKHVCCRLGAGDMYWSCWWSYPVPLPWKDSCICFAAELCNNQSNVILLTQLCFQT